MTPHTKTIQILIDYLTGYSKEEICQKHCCNQEDLDRTIVLTEQAISQALQIEPAAACRLLDTVRERVISILQTNRELSAAIDSSYDGIWITDGKGNTLRINKAIERITGLKAKDVLGKNMKELVAKGIFNESATLRVMEKRQPVTIMQQVITGIETIVTGNPVFDEAGNLFRIISNVRDITELNRLKKQLEDTEKQNQHFHSEIQRLKLKLGNIDNIIAKSKKMMQVLETALRVASFDTTVLLLGESGVGKEVIAQLIHHSSARRNEAFIRVNCAALPTHLLESELFGYEGGAFTGANRQGKPGMFELAHKGSIFLDEISEIPLELQAKLLRILQENELTRLGGTRPIRIDTRVIAATNQNLQQMVKDKAFREDLYYRLNVVPITIPPLRERKEDIPELVHYFLGYFNQKHGTSKIIPTEVYHLLLQYDWPGNVRELKNLIERLVVMTQEDVIMPEHLPQEFRYPHPSQNGKRTLKSLLESFEREIILDALNRYGSTYKAARALGISQSTMDRKARKYRQPSSNDLTQK